MTIKEVIKRDFGVDLPISGGFGNSIETPIIIHRTDINDYVGLEHFILNCLGKGRKIEWRILEQGLLTHNGRKIDKVKIETKQTTENEIITQIENFYFDLSDCLGNEIQTDHFFNEKETIEKIRKRIVELGTLNEFNKKCIDLLIKDELYDDFDLTGDFADVIFNDESFPLFESMMKNRNKPIMDVLRIIGEELNQS